MRLGMAFAHADLINVLNKIKPPYNINAATQSLALEALDKSAVKDKMVQDILSEKENLASALSEVPEIQTVYPSDANFLLVKIADAHGIYQKLIQHLVIVRDRSKVKLCDDCLRITVGTEEENRMFFKIFKRDSELKMEKPKVLFIDRDGTIIVEPPSDFQVDSLEKLAFLPEAISYLRKISEELDFELVMVTNQDGLGTDSFPEETFWPAHQKMLDILEGENIHFKEILIDRSF